MMADSPFKRKASNTGGEDWEIPDPGLHPATVIALVDLGTHDNEYQGKATDPKRILFVVWELATRDTDGNPFIVGEGFTDSLHKKANWRKLLAGWRGRDFSEGEEFDPVNIINVKCLVTIAHGISGKNKKYTHIAAVAPPMKGQAIPDCTKPLCMFHLSMINSTSAAIDIPDWMPRYMGDVVTDVMKESHEWKALKESEFRTGLIPAANGSGQQNGSPTTRHPAPAETAREMAAATAEREKPPF
jgi:hypothetical protein